MCLFFVGDHPTANIEGSKSIGMYSVYVPGYYGAKCDRADLVCPNFAQLPTIVINASKSKEIDKIKQAY